MALSPNRPRKLPGGIMVLILSLLCVALMTFWVREGTVGPLHTARSVVETIVTPVKNLGAFVGTPFRAVADFVSGINFANETAEELHAQNEELRSSLVRMEEYRQENERLSALLELKDAYDLESVGARVIATGSDSWNQVITINKGVQSGFSVGMPVMSANGLIGQIESVSAASSVVRLMTDNKSGVAAFLQKSRVEGVVIGSIDGVLHLEYIEVSVDVQVGDAVITSGSGGIYPKGIAIGEVLSVEFAPADTYKTIVVRPISKVSTYEEVFVLVGSESVIPNYSESDQPQDGGESAGGQDANDSANNSANTSANSSENPAANGGS